MQRFLIGVVVFVLLMGIAVALAMVLPWMSLVLCAAVGVALIKFQNPRSFFLALRPIQEYLLLLAVLIVGYWVWLKIFLASNTGYAFPIVLASLLVPVAFYFVLRNFLGSLLSHFVLAVFFMLLCMSSLTPVDLTQLFFIVMGFYFLGKALLNLNRTAFILLGICLVALLFLHNYIACILFILCLLNKALARKRTFAALSVRMLKNKWSYIVTIAILLGYIFFGARMIVPQSTTNPFPDNLVAVLFWAGLFFAALHWYNSPKVDPNLSKTDLLSLSLFWFLLVGLSMKNYATSQIFFNSFPVLSLPFVAIILGIFLERVLMSFLKRFPLPYLRTSVLFFVLCLAGILVFHYLSLRPKKPAPENNGVYSEETYQGATSVTEVIPTPFPPVPRVYPTKRHNIKFAAIHHHAVRRHFNHHRNKTKEVPADNMAGIPVPAELKDFAGLNFKFVDTDGKEKAAQVTTNFDLGAVEAMGEDSGQASWKGFFYAPYSGSYTFAVQTNQRLKLILDDSEIISKTDDSAEQRTYSKQLRRGVYSIGLQMKYKQQTILLVLWGKDIDHLQEISSPFLYHKAVPVK